MTQSSANPASEATPRLPFQSVVSLLSTAARWRILAALLAEPQTSSDLARAFGLTVNAVGKHLNVLSEAGLITMGRGRVYSIAPAFRPPAGSTDLDLGPCIIRLDQLR